MIIEYYATDLEDRLLEQALDNYHISEWFNPEDGYYVLETDNQEVISIMQKIGVELYIVGEKIVGTNANL